MKTTKSAGMAVLLWAALTMAAHAELDPMTQSAVDSFDATFEQWKSRADGGPGSTDGSVAVMKWDARHMMMIKNGLSLYRDGVLNQQQVVNLHWIVSEHSQLTDDYVRVKGKGLTPAEYELVKVLDASYTEAFHLSEMARDEPGFVNRMDRYQSGVGYEAYRKAQDFGIEQVWLDDESVGLESK